MKKRNLCLILVFVMISQFIKAVISCAGLQWVVAITTVVGAVFAGLSYWHKGVDLYLTEVYWYDEYERMGKWNLVDADYKFW